jgi:hypothetical protein
LQLPATPKKHAQRRKAMVVSIAQNVFFFFLKTDDKTHKEKLWRLEPKKRK